MTLEESALVDSEPGRLCRVCARQSSRYTCPRCNSPYCSLDCYKQHGRSCTESFYRAQSEAQLRSTRASRDEQRRMRQVLHHMHLQQHMDEGGSGGGGSGGGGSDSGGEEEEEEEEAAAARDALGGVLSEATLARLLARAAACAEALHEQRRQQRRQRRRRRGAAAGAAAERAAARSGFGAAGSAAGPGWAEGEQSSAEDGRSSSEDEQSSADDEQSSGLDEGDDEELRALLEEAFQVDVEADLTQQERDALERLADNGGLRAAGAVQAWVPWWDGADVAALRLAADGRALVAEVGSGGMTRRPGGSGGTSGGGVPLPPDAPLLPLASLTSRPPSPLLRWHLLQLLFSYCFVMRRFNGEPRACAAEAAQQLLAVCPVLAAQAPRAAAAVEAEGAPALDARTAVMACVELACNPPGGHPAWRLLVAAVWGDVAGLLQLGRACVLLALTDGGRLLGEAATELRRSAGGGGGGNGRSGGSSGGAVDAQLLRSLKAAAKKLVYFLSWANEQPGEVYDGLGMAVAAEWRQLQQQVRAGGSGSGQNGGVEAELSSIITGSAAAAAAAAARRRRPPACGGGGRAPAPLVEEVAGAGAPAAAGAGGGGGSPPQVPAPQGLGSRGPRAADGRRRVSEAAALAACPSAHVAAGVQSAGARGGPPPERVAGGVSGAAGPTGGGCRTGAPGATGGTAAATARAGRAIGGAARVQGGRPGSSCVGSRGGVPGLQAHGGELPAEMQTLSTGLSTGSHAAGGASAARVAQPLAQVTAQQPASTAPLDLWSMD